MTAPHHLTPFVASLALALAACSSGSEPAGPPPLEGADIGGDFTLTGEDGEDVSFGDFDGQYRTVYFGYTFCPDVCPVDVQRAMAGLKRFEESDPERAAKIQPLFVSVDPQRDTPEVLREFTNAFHPRLIGMTGTKEQLDEVVADFGGTYSIGEESEAGGYLVDHTRFTFLFGPDGEPIAILPVDESAEAVAAELDRWVR
ncbi:SCO family protein [Alteriqipengyuania lutimaris]|uniref:SCO family protein n=1 Tax=Alteriqipengyuania lutimaris TaxID=1538146 RepID=A0A395LKM8_9SPHN|nr:SCO family protein [Alteriqipengyuania lutimaris]MBB3033644.1 protein SCO1/2 [Alteriqipengyuania lutimaris]RDS77361.1 SCO family protein [Alteriqipengyuania lutimaris]